MTNSSEWDEDQVEQWFVDRAVPHLIRDYSATEDIFTRAFPFLGTVMIGQLFLAFTPDNKGWSQALWFILGIGLFTAALAAVNRLRGRRLLALPDHVGTPELAIFVLVPPLLRMLSTGDGTDFPLWVLVNLVLVLMAYLMTSYGLFPMIPWALRQMGRQASRVLNLFAKSLPLLLLFSAFLFVNAEIWQVATDIPWAAYGIVLGFIVLIGSLFIAVALRPMLDDLNQFTSWDQVCRLANNTPVGAAAPPTGGLETPPLSRGEKLNLGILLFVAQAIQVLLVALMVAGFYIVFGLLTVREKTILQWTTADTVDTYATLRLFGDEMVLSKPLVLVAGFIAAFSGLQFAVSVVTDATYRREFADDISAEIREALAARCRYMASAAPATFGGDHE